MSEMSEFSQIRGLLLRNQERLKTLQETSQKRLDAILNEITTILETVEKIEQELATTDRGIQERKDVISNLTEQLAQIREVGTGVEAHVAGIYNQLSEEQKAISVLEATRLEVKGQLEALETKLEEHKTQHTSVTNQAEKVQQEIAGRTESREQEINELKESLAKAEWELKRVQEENPIAEFLLQEGIEPPELDILTYLIYKKEASVDDLKRLVKVPPAMATVKIKELEKKGILKIDGNQVKLAISIS